MRIEKLELGTRLEREARRVRVLKIRKRERERKEKGERFEPGCLGVLLSSVWELERRLFCRHRQVYIGMRKGRGKRGCREGATFLNESNGSLAGVWT